VRVPSIGLPLDERLIIREGYRWAERMLRDYQDPPTFSENVAKALASARHAVLDFCRMLVRG
jgi:hypothetical protein